MLRRFALLALFVVVSSVLAACDTAEERAQKHYEKGVSLLAEGEVDRALVEFRNVFKLNGFHKDARLAYAKVEEERGNIDGAYGQYLRLVEQYPDNFEGRRALSRLAASLNRWDEVERHVTVAKKVQPDDPVVQSVQAGLDYRNARQSSDESTAALAVKVSETLLESHPDLPVARRVVIFDLVQRKQWAAALEEVNAGLEQTPEMHLLYGMRLELLKELGREAEVEVHLKELAARFPENRNFHLELMRGYIRQGRLDDAEDYLRSQIDPASGDPKPHQELIVFLRHNISREAALAEVNTILSEVSTNRDLFRSIRAELGFETGDRDRAINEIEDILSVAEPSELSDRIKVSLARMLIQTGNPVGARARIEEVLERDPTQVNALKLKASWLIEDDQPGDALVELRTALDQAPRDFRIMTLMAQAHARAGNRELSGEMLALAVEASSSAPPETMRYANFLIREEKFLSAEDVLQSALKVRSEHLGLLSALGSVYLRMEDWSRSQGVIDRLQGLDTEPSRKLAVELMARQLAGQNRSSELEELLSGLADGESGLQATASIIRLRLAQNDAVGALTYLDTLLANEPGNPTLRFIRANVLAIDNQPDQAQAIYRALLKEFPREDKVWLALYNLHRSRGELDMATEVLTEAQIAAPESADLKWSAAGEAEMRGDIEQAISIYEAIYAANSNSQVIANNLASLISSHREDDESLQRASTIAQRLRDTEVPAFQDTYGWIAHRLGNHEEALPYLEDAAKVLIKDPTVQYHLGVVYNVLGQRNEALEQFRKTQTLIESGGPRPPYLEKMMADIDRLSASQ